MTTLITIAIALVALYLAFKLLESLLKVLIGVLVLAAIYWAAAPSMGWPPLPDLVQTAWFDLQRLIPGEWLAPLWDLLKVAE